MKTYLVMRKDFWEQTYRQDGRSKVISSNTFYPRLVQADSAYDAIEHCFDPEPLRPAKTHHLVAIRLSRNPEFFVLEPVHNYRIRGDDA